MFRVENANIFDLDVEMILNPVNCKGVSGAGLAKAFAQKFPNSQQIYESTCRRTVMVPDATGVTRSRSAFKPGDLLHSVEINQDKIGSLTISDETPNEAMIDLLDKRQHIIYFPTKNHWKNPSKYEYIQSGLKELRGLLMNPGILERYGPKVNSVAIPALGCGLGGLDAGVVSNMIMEALEDVEMNFILLDPLRL